MRKRLMKILNIYKDLSREFRASLWFAFCVFLQRGISLLTLPIFTRMLTTQEYGLVTIYNSWYNLFFIVLTLNLTGGIFATAYVKYEEDKDKITSSFLGLTTTVTTFFLVIYILFAEKINQFTGMNTCMTILMFLEIYITPAYHFWSMEQKFEVKYKKLVALTIIVALVTPVVGVIAVLLSTNKAIAKIVSAVIIQVIFYIFIYIKIMVKGKHFFSFKYWKYAISFSLPLIIHYLCAVILDQSDRLMISKIIGNDKAAIYSVAYSIASTISLVITGINYSFDPWAMRMIKAQKYDSIKEKIRMLLPFVAFMILFLMLFEPELVRLFASDGYYEAIWVIPPIAVAIYFVFVNSIFIRYELFFEMKFLIMFSTVLSAILNVVLNYIFIPLCGYYAAGYTTFVCYVTLTITHYFAMKYVSHKYLNGQKVFETRFVLKLSLLVILLSGVVLILYNFTILRYLFCLLLFIVIIIFRRRIIEYVKKQFKYE